MSQERPLRLHAGSWSLEFERWSGWVRNIRLGSHEVLRGVYESVRGADWATYRFYSTSTHISQGEGRFEASWNLECDDLDVTWEGRLECDGVTLTITLEASVDETISTRRTGLCVLHPRELQGSACVVTHPSGETEAGAFPTSVRPDQPFREIRALSHRTGPSCEVTLAFEGEVFETEDQRNWSDASFKTYCRPQDWPQPYELAAGTKVRHSVTLTFEGTPDEYKHETTPHLSLGEDRPMPLLGTRGKGDDERFDFVFRQDSEMETWIATGEDMDLCFAASRGELGFLKGPVFYGLHHDFVGLNRNRPDMGQFDGVAYGITPQVHTFDERSIMENVHSQADVFATAREISGGKPIFVGPILFARSYDLRLEDPIAAAWLMASLGILSNAGAMMLSYFDAKDFGGLLGDLFDAVREFRGGRVGLMTSTDPYRTMGVRLTNDLGHRDFLINMTPFTDEVGFDGAMHTLTPYQVLALG